MEDTYIWYDFSYDGVSPSRSSGVPSGGCNTLCHVNVTHPGRRVFSDPCDGFSSNYGLLTITNTAGIQRVPPLGTSNDNPTTRRKPLTISKTRKWRMTSGRRPLLYDSPPTKTPLLLAFVLFPALPSRRKRRKPPLLGYSRTRENVCIVFCSLGSDCGWN